ncbi:MAG: SH3 domain-containing protein, partial [Lachnospiraceae bacterium]|nr:SH3 domain-containing protein [Lachnospiraceae bacterium]
MKKIRVIILTALCALALGILFFNNPISAYADNAKATVVVDGAYVRSSPSSSGDIIASVMKNDVVEVISSSSDSAGNTWYKIVVDAKTYGYIRSDLVSTSGSVPASTSTETSTSTSTSTSTTTSVSADVTPVEPTTPAAQPTELVEVEPVDGKISSSVNIRKGPST